jgi:hypothetical protein
VIEPINTGTIFGAIGIYLWSIVLSPGSSIPDLVFGESSESALVLTELPELSTVGILVGCSFDRPLADLSTTSVAE